MTEIRAFLTWQWREILTAHWTSWAYFAGMAMMIAGLVMDTATAPQYFGVSLDVLLTATGGVAVLAYLGSLMFEFQLARYRRERDDVIRKLERKEQ
jgi:membrane-bound ClpP family serine protease